MANFPMIPKLLIFSFTAWTGGDPHIRTLDGHTYTFNGIGDYLLLGVKNGTDAIIQCRMSKAKINPNSTITASRATVFSGFALKTDQGALVEFYLNVSSKYHSLL